MEVEERKSDREARREKLRAVANDLDGSATRKPGWVKRVRVLGDKLVIKVVQSGQNTPD